MNLIFTQSRMFQLFYLKSHTCLDSFRRSKWALLTIKLSRRYIFKGYSMSAVKQKSLLKVRCQPLLSMYLVFGNMDLNSPCLVKRVPLYTERDNKSHICLQQVSLTLSNRPWALSFSPGNQILIKTPFYQHFCSCCCHISATGAAISHFKSLKGGDLVW